MNGRLYFYVYSMSSCHFSYPISVYFLEGPPVNVSKGAAFLLLSAYGLIRVGKGTQGQSLRF